MMKHPCQVRACDGKQGNFNRNCILCPSLLYRDLTGYAHSKLKNVILVFLIETWGACMHAIYDIQREKRNVWRQCWGTIFALRGFWGQNFPTKARTSVWNITSVLKSLILSSTFIEWDWTWDGGSSAELAQQIFRATHMLVIYKRQKSIVSFCSSFFLLAAVGLNIFHDVYQDVVTMAPLDLCSLSISTYSRCPAFYHLLQL